MASVSRQQRLINFLSGHDNQRARASTIVHALAPQWMTAEQAETTIERACADPACNVTKGAGRTVTYWGTEIGSRVALYEAVQRIFQKYLGPQELGLRRIHAVQPRAGHGTGEGSWTRPDLMLFADPRKRDSVHDARRTHAFEIEQRNGFDVRSVYQAYEQGRGANYTWVFAHSDITDKRVEMAAQDLGVGVVVFTNPSSYGTYRLSIDAALRKPPETDRQHFLLRCGVPDFG